MEYMFCSYYSMIFLELDKKLSNFEKKDCFQNNRGQAAKCYWSDDVISVSSLVLLVRSWSTEGPELRG